MVDLGIAATPEPLAARYPYREYRRRLARILLEAYDACFG
jgi:hypothetical protein